MQLCTQYLKICKAFRETRNFESHLIFDQVRDADQMKLQTILKLLIVVKRMEGWGIPLMEVSIRIVNLLV